MKRIYLDTCILIYLIEKHPTFYPQIAERLQLMTGYQLAVSPLLRMEALVKPLKEQNTELIGRFERFLEQQIMLPIPTEVYDIALQLRVSYGLKTPDALHLAIAQHHGCTELWTNDDRLDKAVKHIALEVLR